MSSASAGRVLLIFKGAYNSSTRYEPMDVVLYQGDSYVCQQTSQGNVPTNTTYWKPFTQTGSEIASVKETLTNEVVTRSTLGAHSLFPNNAKTPSAAINGVTFTVNADKTVSTSGKGTLTTGNKYSTLLLANITDNLPLEKGKTYKLSGCPLGGGANKYDISLFCRASSTLTVQDYGSGATFTVPNDTTRIDWYVRCYYNIDVSGLIFKPMITMVEDSDPTYQPYAKPNTELTKDDIGLTENEYANGCVNLLKNEGTSVVKNGVTFTVNSDKTVNVNDTASAVTYFDFSTDLLSAGIKKGVRYHFSGRPTGSGNDKVILQYTSGGSGKYIEDAGNGFDFVLPSDATGVKIYIMISAGTSVSNRVYKPMITVADMPNSDYNHYVPYAKSNKELTDNKADKSDLASISITGTTNSTGSAITEGTFFYLNGQLVKAKTAIANGATLTSGTNYVASTGGSLNDLGIDTLTPTDANFAKGYCKSGENSLTITAVAAVINKITTHDKWTGVHVLFDAGAVYCFIGYLYGNKHYGGGIIVGTTSDRTYKWSRSNDADTLTSLVQ